jgi:hypothetical protein
MFAVLLCTLASLATTQTPEVSVREDLAEYYKTGKKPASWDASVGKLADSNADLRRKAAAQLVELMDQSRKDELSGKAPWLGTPVWGGRPENPARNLRSEIVGALEKTAATAEVLPLVQWLLSRKCTCRKRLPATSARLRARRPMTIAAC